MFYNKPNGRVAAPIASLSDIRSLQLEGLESLTKRANKGDVKAIACIQRLVNSNELPEGIIKIAAGN